MHILDAKGERVELDFVGEVPTPGATARAGLPGVGASFAAPLHGTAVSGGAIAAVVSGVFGLRSERVVRAAWAPVPRERVEPPPAIFRERASGLLRVLHREVVMRFRPRTGQTKRRKLLKE